MGLRKTECNNCSIPFGRHQYNLYSLEALSGFKSGKGDFISLVSDVEGALLSGNFPTVGVHSRFYQRELLLKPKVQ